MEKKSIFLCLDDGLIGSERVLGAEVVGWIDFYQKFRLIGYGLGFVGQSNGLKNY